MKKLNRITVRSDVDDTIQIVENKLGKMYPMVISSNSVNARKKKNERQDCLLRWMIYI
jgi:hypothetical protein